MTPPPDVDGDVSPIVQRYTERRAELAIATTNVVVDAKEAGRVLALAGDLLRRSEAVRDDKQRLAECLAIDRIERRAIEAYVDSIDVSAERTRLARGLEDAFEALLADDDEPDERELYTESAEAALAARDALASVRAALVCAHMSTAKLDAKLGDIDAGLPKRARLLVALNPMRRREAEALDASERAAAWWFSARMQCDFLVALYRQKAEANTSSAAQITQPHNGAHLARCEECQRDVEAASHAYTPQHVTASSLWRRQHGQATSTEIAFMDSHAKGCKDCQRALDALAQSEE